MTRHLTEELSRYADGELSAEETRLVEAHLRDCTECMRELALIRSMGEAMRNIEPRKAGMWQRVHRRIARPIGWTLILAGFLVWVILAVIAWFRETLTIEWLSSTAVGTGLLILLISISYEQYREWKDSPYKHIER